MQGVKTKRQSGFTLVEVIVVAAIIAILAGILVPMIFNQIDEARIAKARGLSGVRPERFNVEVEHPGPYCYLNRMPRKPRIHCPGALYHVIIRGNASQDIFFGDDDRRRFYFLMHEGIERYGHRILAFCLMTNHLHLLIQVGEISLSRIIQNLSFRYTAWVNRRLNRSGHLFQGRYKAVILDAETHLLELVAYIHLNPVRARMVNLPEIYRWSSHCAYLGNESIPWLSQDFVLGLFSAKMSLARRLFSVFVSDRISSGQRDEFYGGTSLDNRIIGDDGFVEGVLRKVDSMPLSKPTLEAVLEVVTRMYDLREDALSAASQSRLPSEARSLAAWGIRELTDATLSDLALRFCRDASTLSASIRRVEMRGKKDPVFAEKIRQMKLELQDAIIQA